MHEESAARCASTKAAVTSQQPWREFIRGLILPSQSSRESECRERYLSQGGEREETSSSSSSSIIEEVCSTCNDVPFRLNKRLRCIGCNKRRPSFSDTESVLDIVKMPVGKTNPVLKSSFSLTSLRSSTPSESPEHCVPLRLKTERAYHSLTKKSRQGTEQLRKSWGSGISQDGKEFWEGFQADYDYLMAQNILDRDPAAAESAGEGSPENGILRAPPVWSLTEFMDHFAQLNSWLKGIQDSVHGTGDEDVADGKLRAERLEDMKRQRFRLDDFKEEAEKLIERYPGSEREVLARVKEVSEKWEAVEAMTEGWRKCEGEKGAGEKTIEHEIRRLRKWLRGLDARQKPLSFRHGWTKAELEEKSKELMVLCRDLESQKKVFPYLLKLCEKEESHKWVAVKFLERKYHLHYLQCLEWQCYVESIRKEPNKIPSNVSNESDGAPEPKIARFASSSRDRYESEDSDASYGLKSEEKILKGVHRSTKAPTERKDAKSPAPQPSPGMMVGGKPETQPEVELAESILGVAGSSSALGTGSRNAGASFGCYDDEAASGPTPGEKTPVEGRENRPGDSIATPKPAGDRVKERPPNTGSFTWRHLDTDSEQEKAMSEEESKLRGTSKECLKEKDAETTSCGWTYKSEAGVGVKPKAAVRLDFEKREEAKEMKYFSAKNIPLGVASEEPFSSRKLVEYADEMMRYKPCKRWRSWRERTRRGSKEVFESGGGWHGSDASGEYTEDSDDCQKSEGEGTLGLAGRRYGSADGILEARFAPRRQRHQPARRRPLSMSSAPRSQSLKPLASKTESHLNRMMELEMSYSTPARGSKTMAGEEGSGGSSSRKKMKIRKEKNKKSDSGSEGLTLSGSDSGSVSSPGKQMRTLVKSGSFSGVIRRQRGGASVLDSVTGTETEEEASRLIAPAFRLGPEAGAVHMAGECVSENWFNDVNNDLNKVQVEEQPSLNWDHYQEKYQSEAYSEEPPDSDAAKKLLEFGEDYWKYLENQSDCASTRSRSFVGWGSSKIDSDSDVLEVRHTLKQSLEQLNNWKVKFNRTIRDEDPDDCVFKTFLDEIIGACKRNVECLTKLLMQVKDEALLAREHSDTLNVKDSWEKLKYNAEVHKAKQLRKEMGLLKEELLSLGAAVDSLETNVTSREELEGKITKLQNELNLMKKGKERLLQSNVSVHKFLASTKHSDGGLREEVTELYQLWDQTFCRVSSQLINLQSLSQAWHDFEDHLTQLQCALKTDTLKVLDYALKSRNPTPGASLSLQDIAVILSDRGSASKDPVTVAEVSPGTKLAVPAPLPALSTEGSLSDSGISDSGSEQELSEREKRLSQLKRLAKRLESILAPGSQALSSMFKRIEEAEADLRELQKTCRDLIVRSASSEEIRRFVAATPTLDGLDPEGTFLAPPALEETGDRPKSSAPLESAEKSAGVPSEVESEDCDGGRPEKKFWLWRVLRYAFPFQLAIVALFCIASLLEPRCCDSLNNLELSLHPQLRYDSGPPPV